MADFQQTVNVKLAGGIPGEFYDASPHRSMAYVVTSNEGAAPTYGYAFTKLPTEDVAKPGSAGNGAVFVGIGTNPKEAMAYSSLAATMSVPDGKTMGLTTFGRLFVISQNAAAEGQAAFFENATGKISAFAAGSSQTGYTEIANSKFIKGGDAGDLAVLELGD